MRREAVVVFGENHLETLLGPVAALNLQQLGVTVTIPVTVTLIVTAVTFTSTGTSTGSAGGGESLIKDLKREAKALLFLYSFFLRGKPTRCRLQQPGSTLAVTVTVTSTSTSTFTRTSTSAAAWCYYYSYCYCYFYFYFHFY